MSDKLDIHSNQTKKELSSYDWLLVSYEFLKILFDKNLQNDLWEKFKKSF